MSHEYEDRAKVRWVPIRHDQMHFLMALLAFHDGLVDREATIEEVLASGVLKYMTDTYKTLAEEEEDQYERLKLMIQHHHKALCSKDSVTVLENKQALLSLTKNKLVLLMVYDAFASAAYHKQPDAVLHTLRQLAEHGDRMQEDAKELQRDLHVLAQSAFGDEIEVNLY